MVLSQITYVHTYIHKYTHAHTHTWLHTHACTHTRILTHACTQTYAHTHTFAVPNVPTVKWCFEHIRVPFWISQLYTTNKFLVPKCSHSESFTSIWTSVVYVWYVEQFRVPFASSPIAVTWQVRWKLLRFLTLMQPISLSSQNVSYPQVSTLIEQLLWR